MRIVILGYSGLIGSHILKYLTKNTYSNLVCVGRDISHKLLNYKKISYIKWNFKSFQNKNLFFLKDADIIINCTGKVDNVANNAEYINVKFIKKLLEYLISCKSKARLVHLSSVAVYGENRRLYNKSIFLNENSKINGNSFYSKNKLKSELLIKKFTYSKSNKNFSFTILRISNVIGGKKKSNLFNFVRFLLKTRIWFQSFDQVTYNFINVNDVAQAVYLNTVKLKVSKNKTYNITDDFMQTTLLYNYQNLIKKKIISIKIPFVFLKFIINFLPLPIKIKNFIFMISNKISYINQKAKKELKFKPKYSLPYNLKILDE